MYLLKHDFPPPPTAKLQPPSGHLDLYLVAHITIFRTVLNKFKKLDP